MFVDLSDLLLLQRMAVRLNVELGADLLALSERAYDHRQ